MPSADLYGAVVAFLVGDSGDVRTSVNAEQASLIPAGAVVATRAPRGKTPQRGRPTKTPAIDVVPSERSGASRGIGIGLKERDVAVRLEITVRQKDVVGANQLAILEKVQRALVNRYDGKSNLTVPVTGSAATFARSSADPGPVDRSPVSSELETATVDLVFTFREPMGANT